MICSGIFDVLGVIALEYTREELVIGFGPSVEPLTRLFMSLTGAMLFTHMFGCFLMTLNRYTAVCHPLRHHAIWTASIVNVLLMIDIIVAFAAFIPLYSNNFVYEPCRNVVTVITEVACLILICLAIYAIRQYGNGIKADKSLILVTAINCVLSLLECIYDISFLLNIESESVAFLKWIANQYQAYSFLIMTSNAYSIVLLSGAVRQEILNRWRLPTPTTRLIMPATTIN
ncbi:hypothetical protein ANCCAN_26941 [Ancylostoma caninum]|uniref:Serpentine receptor class gamma n=1 Tax=Ancylostoma caninum TaxID=29170 RepID=A0A368F5E3_ANCCA|nr:hypothetical protein ANCCAN_26941 [Ancylostoma caninum]